MPRGYATIRSRSHTPEARRGAGGPGAAGGAAWPRSRTLDRATAGAASHSGGAAGLAPPAPPGSIHSRLLQYATLNARSAALLSGKIAKLSE